ncbi:MAG: VWA domain-containing protein [Acidobacteriota bacterium]
MTVQISAVEARKRIDVTIEVPERSAIKVDTSDGAISVAGNVASVQARTDTGTISVDVPTSDLSYQFLWTESRPRYVADFDLVGVKERTAGRFEIKGHLGEQDVSKKKKAKARYSDSFPPIDMMGDSESKKINPAVSRAVALNMTTARGIILLNVPASEVGSDLRERPLTEAAKAIIRSGDSLLMQAIRRSAPKYFADYERSLPPYKREPAFADRKRVENLTNASVQRALVRVTDLRNRAIAGLKASDFEVFESGSPQEIISVDQSTAPFNLVLLLDVSGSVENYVDFIRKAARNFVNAVDKNDRVSIVIFNEDVNVLSNFTTDKVKLSESLDTFDAGGGTAYYDALGYIIADTLRPLKGDRTAIVVLTDGDDNLSFLAFDSLIGSIEESGALIYPLYVPSGLIAFAEQTTNSDIDPMRKKYMSLSAKSEGEGAKLAKASGGVYYPITRITEIETAYEDIVQQLRTAYVVKFRSKTFATDVSPRLKIKVKRENTFVTINSITAEK